MPSPDHSGRANTDRKNDGRGILACTRRLIRAWWHADRVRVSPREGRLLRLQPPCIVRIGREYAQVSRRCNGQTDAGPYVRYDCTVDNRHASLLVELNPDLKDQAVFWTVDGETERYAADDIEVFA